MTKEKYLVMRDREYLPNPVYWNLISQTSPITKKIYETKITTEWLLLKSGRQKTIFLKNDWDKVGRYIANKLLYDKKYFKNLEKNIQQAEEKIINFLKKYKNTDFTKLSFKELIDLANKIRDLCVGYDVANVLSWFVAGDKFQEKVYKLINIPQKDFLLLTTPIVKTFVNKLEYDLLKYAKLIKEKKINLEKIAEKLSDSYGWIPFGYDGFEYWDKKYFIKKLRDNIKKKKIDENIKQIEKEDEENLIKRNRIIKKFKLNKKQLELIKKINTLALWTDERKKFTFQLFYCYSKILLELGRRYKIPFKNLKYLFTEELSKVRDNKNILKITNDRINNEFMLEYKNGKGGILSIKKKDKILREMEKQIKQVDIKGIVASKGPKNIYQSKVKVLLSSQEVKKIKKGDFLVATMTSPEYILAMKKAIGFITDEGGITCHAAIVAREMNKPCIIGTKIATKVLKDNDLVEVDANKGIVRKIK